MRTYSEIIDDLNSKIPRDVIETREGGNGKRLSYLAGWYVIDRLNKVLGQGQWAYSATTEKLYEGDSNGKAYVCYKATVRLVATLADKTTEFTDVGFGDGMDARNPGKAHELALKEAVTDGLKRCARCLGDSMGNALYSKDGDGIEAEAPKNQTRADSAPVGPKINPVGGVPSQPTAAVSGAPAKGSSRDAVNKLINQTSKVAMDMKKLSLAQAKEMLAAYKAETKEQLTDEQANELLGKLKEIIK